MIFCDPGIDDALAIMYALLNPHIEVVGLVTGYGNVSEKQATENATYLLQLAGRSDIPIISGAKGPFSGEHSTYYPEIHGEKGLGPIHPPNTIMTKVQEFCEALKIIEKYQEKLVIVDIGRSTSLAITFLLAGNEMVNKVKRIYMMGGAFNYPGNVTATAEANFHGDAIATSLVLEKGRNITIIPLNISNHSIISKQLVNSIHVQMNHDAFSGIFKPVMDYYIEAYTKLIPGLNGAPLHDVLTIFAVVHPEEFKYVTRSVRIVTTGIGKGTLIADFRAIPKEEKPERLKKIALQFNYDAFIRDFFQVMTQS